MINRGSGGGHSLSHSVQGESDGGCLGMTEQWNNVLLLQLSQRISELLLIHSCRFLVSLLDI